MTKKVQTVRCWDINLVETYSVDFFRAGWVLSQMSATAGIAIVVFEKEVEEK